MFLQVFLFLYFLEKFRTDRCNFFSICLVNSSVKPSGPGLPFVGNVFFIIIIYSISLLVINMFSWSSSSQFSFGWLYISRILSISSRLSNFWHLIVYSISYGFLVLMQYPLRFLLFHFLFCLSSFSPLLSESGQKVCQFCLPFQRTSSCFYWFFFYCFFSLYFIDFLSAIYVFLLSADFRLCLFFF